MISWVFPMLITPEKTIAGPKIPAQAALAEMIEDTLLGFAIAVKAEDFIVFYRRISKYWQNQITKEQLLNEFTSFIDKKIDLTILEGKKLNINKKPILDNNGWLCVQGSCVTKPSNTAFNFKYLMENGARRLAGIKIKRK